MTYEAGEKSGAEALWVLARVKNTVCAFSSASVESILPLDQKITPLPESDQIRLGIIQYRSTMLSIVDLRVFMGMVSLNDERSAFEQMLDQRKHDHTKWVDELKRCLDTGDRFQLATDPHKCAFGQWYDQYEPESHAVGYQLKKIDSPHRKLHESAEKLFALSQIDDVDQRQQQQKKLLEKVTQPCMRQVVDCLDATKSAFQEASRKIAIVLFDGHRRGGVLVDEVLAVEELFPVKQSSCLQCHSNACLVHHVAQRKGDQELILALDPQVLLQAQLQVGMGALA